MKTLLVSSVASVTLKTDHVDGGEIDYYNRLLNKLVIYVNCVILVCLICTFCITCIFNNCFVVVVFCWLFVVVVVLVLKYAVCVMVYCDVVYT